MAKPIVAITMGDPAGVGPEVVLKALADPRVRRACRTLVLGDLGVLKRAGKGGTNSPRLISWNEGQSLAGGDGAAPVYSLTSLSADQSRPGAPSEACGAAAYHYITRATELVQARVADAIATAPISKRVLQLAGYRYPGHTELFAELTGAPECRMMFLAERLKVVLVTGHLPLARVKKELTRSRIRTTLELTHQTLRKDFGAARPRIAVAALNPHAGEMGILGTEEQTVIGPALADARRKGIRAEGPFPADTIFFHALRGDYDAVVCMYHDQGLIPIKLHHFFGGVAVTLGLPFIRTSVDHGTAYDIAGKNRADGSSMREAILAAARLARQRRRARRT